MGIEKRHRRAATCAVVLALAMVQATSEPLRGQAVSGGSPVVGPERGSLVVIGGALRSPEIYERFIELAGGPEAHIVVVPTAGGRDEYDDSYSGLETWRSHGARNVTLLHTRDRAIADTEAFVAPLRTATGVYFPGGRQWRLVDAYAGTRTEAAFREVLDRGGVIGGSSAGATIQGSYLVRGDTDGNELMMGDHTEGFGYLRNVAVDQHVLRRNRHFDLIEVIQAHPELLGVGIDENTAIVVHGDEFEVIGESQVLIYDYTTTTDDGGKFYFLLPGDRFDLASRVGFRQSRGDWVPLQGLQKRSWGGR